MSQPGDLYEQEADRVAEQVMRMPAPTLQRTCASCGAGGSPCPKCESDEKDSVQRKAGPLSSRDASVPDNFLSDLGPGQLLDAETRTFLEPRFGHDFSRVRVHADGEAANAARAVQARAYTVERDIVFGSGEYAPATVQGKRLLAHELVHVVQQARASMQGAPAVPRQEPKDAGEETGSDPISSRTRGLHAHELAHVTHQAGNVPTLRRSPEQDTALTGGATLAPPSASPMASQVGKVEINVQPVCVANDDGSNPTVIPSLATAQSIWGKCCVTLKVASAKKVSKTSFRVLDEDPASSTFSPSAEEADLMKAAGAGGGTISVIVPEKFKNGAKEGKDIEGGGVTYMPNKANATCFLVEGSDPSNVAHELGHAMGNGKHIAGTVMEGSGAYDKANPSKVSTALCDTARKFPFGTTVAKADCTVTPT